MILALWFTSHLIILCQTFKLLQLLSKYNQHSPYPMKHVININFILHELISTSISLHTWIWRQKQTINLWQSMWIKRLYPTRGFINPFIYRNIISVYVDQHNVLLFVNYLGLLPFVKSVEKVDSFSDSKFALFEASKGLLLICFILLWDEIFELHLIPKKFLCRHVILIYRLKRLM